MKQPDEGKTKDRAVDAGIIRDGLSTAEYFRYSRSRGGSRHVGYMTGRRLEGGGKGVVLDVGCGAGFSARSFAGRKPELFVVGCDIDAGLIMYSAGLEPVPGNMALIATPEDTLPFADASFDLVYSEGSFHHFRLKNKMIDEMWRVLKPGGNLLVADLNPESFKARAFVWFVSVLERLGVAGKTARALAGSIKESSPPGEVVEMFSSRGIICAVTKTVASVYYEARKPAPADS